MFPTPVLQRMEVNSMQLHEMCVGFTSILQIFSGLKFEFLPVLGVRELSHSI